MKLLYSRAELEALSTEQLASLIAFGGDKVTYYYKDISHFRDKELTILLKNNTSLQVEDAEHLEELKQNKIRYELMAATLAGIEHEQTLKDELMKDIKDIVSSQIKELDSTFNIAINRVAKVATTMEANVTAATESITTKLKDVINTHASTLKELDPEKFGLSMKKVDKITDAFKTLLKD